MATKTATTKTTTKAPAKRSAKPKPAPAAKRTAKPSTPKPSQDDGERIKYDRNGKLTPECEAAAESASGRVHEALAGMSHEERLELLAKCARKSEQSSGPKPATVEYRSIQDVFAPFIGKEAAEKLAIQANHRATCTTNASTISSCLRELARDAVENVDDRRQRAFLLRETVEVETALSDYLAFYTEDRDEDVPPEAFFEPIKLSVEIDDDDRDANLKSISRIAPRAAQWLRHLAHISHGAGITSQGEVDKAKALAERLDNLLERFLFTIGLEHDRTCGVDPATVPGKPFAKLADAA